MLDRKIAATMNPYRAASMAVTLAPTGTWFEWVPLPGPKNLGMLLLKDEPANRDFFTHRNIEFICCLEDT